METFLVFIGFGVLLGLWRVAERSPRWQKGLWVNAALWALTAGLVAGRLGFAAIQLDLFRPDPAAILDLSIGGIFWPAALLAAVLMVPLIARKMRRQIRRTADGLAPVLAPIAVMIWLACWMEGVAYGPTVPENAWWGLMMEDSQGLWQARFPLQLLAALSLLLLLGYLEINSSQFGLGQYSCLVLLVLGVHTLVFSLLRADPQILMLGMPVHVWGSLLFVLLGGAACIHLFDVRKRWQTVPIGVRREDDGY